MTEKIFEDERYYVCQIFIDTHQPEERIYIGYIKIVKYTT